jgi:uncharacterized protein (DUF488 family)
MNKIFTIGFTGKTAEEFFSLLEVNDIKNVIDVRLNNNSQPTGYAKKDDLEFFLKRIVSCKYLHRPDFAPTEALLQSYKSNIIDWETYSNEYLELLNFRGALSNLKKDEITSRVLLCNEQDPDNCHRRLLAEFIKKKWDEIEVVHLGSRIIRINKTKSGTAVLK